VRYDAFLERAIQRPGIAEYAQNSLLGQQLNRALGFEPFDDWIRHG
jgi:hypothetical protein